MANTTFASGNLPKNHLRVNGLREAMVIAFRKTAWGISFFFAVVQHSPGHTLEPILGDFWHYI